MFEDCHGYEKQKDYNDNKINQNNSHRDNQTENYEKFLNNQTIISTICAGKFISRESFIFMSLLTTPRQVALGLKLINNELHALDNALQDKNLSKQINETIEKTFIKLSLLNNDSLDAASKYIKLEADCYNKIKELVDSNLEKLEEQDFSLTHSDKRKTIITSMLYSLLHKISFFIANETIPYHTNINDIVFALTPLTEEQKKLLRKINISKENLNLKKKLLKSFQNEISEKTSYKNFYTTLSPHLLYETITFLEDGRVAFLSKIDTKRIKINQIKNILNNDNYEDSILELLEDRDKLILEQNGYNLNIVWDTPLTITNTIEQYQKIFDDYIAPLRKLYQELGGDVNTAFDEYEMKVVLTLPKQDEPGYNPIQEVIPPNFFSYFKGFANITAYDTPIKLTLYHEDNLDSFDLIIDKKSLKAEQGKDDLANLLTFAEKFYKRSLLESICLSKWRDDSNAIFVDFKTKFTNGESQNNGNLTARLICQSVLLYDHKFNEALYNFANLHRFYTLSIPDTTVEKALERFDKLNQIIEKAKGLSDGPQCIEVTLTNEKPSIIIKDKDDRVLVHALQYDDNKMNYSGRFASSENVEKALLAFDNILKLIEERHNEGIIQSNIIVNEIVEVMNQQNIILTNNFRNMLSILTTLHCIPKELTKKNIDIEGVNIDGENMASHFISIYKKYLGREFLSIKEDGDKIVIDALSQETYKDFFTNNII